MFGSKYSAYNYDEIARNPLYEEIGRILVGLAKDDSVKEKMRSILREGGVGEYGISSERYNMRNNPTIEAARRLEMVYLLVHHPETFDYFSDSNIKFFHGTSGNALPSILKNGLISADKSKKMGIEVTTEEGSFITGKERSFISLTNDLSVAMQYAQMNGKDEGMKFGVMIGFNEERIQNLRRISVSSDCPEIGVIDKIPKEVIDFIGVPQDKVKFVKKLAKGMKIKVLPMDFEIKFYDIVDSPNDISNIILEKLQTRIHEPKNTFHRNGLKALAESAGRGVLKTISRLKERLKGKTREERNKIDDR